VVRFKQAAFAKAIRLAKGRNWLISNIPVDTFLRLAAKHRGEHYYKHTAQKVFDRGAYFRSLPYLELKAISSEDAVVCRHNGRHRAMVLAKAGFVDVPVILYMGVQRKVKQKWPERIYAQSSAEDPEFTIPLPPRLDPDHWPEP